MNKEEALEVILKSAKMYKENLENKKIMFVYKTKYNKIEYIEAVFFPRNFLQLTGVKIINEKIKSSTDFYRITLKNKLSISDFEFNSNGTTPLKLIDLPQIVKIHKVTKMVGDYNYIKPYLCTSKIAGGVNVCLEFKRENNYYVPNTALCEDIRDITNTQQKVIAIFIRDIKQSKYKEITYLAKNNTLKEILKNEEIAQKLDLKLT